MYYEQMRVGRWIVSCFPHSVVFSLRERALRIIEEAIEFGQAVGVSPADVDALRYQVYAKPPGEVRQELAGVSVCALAAAGALGLDLQEVIKEEMDRVEKPEIITRIRAKHMTKVV